MISKKVVMGLTPQQAWEAFALPYDVDRFVYEMEYDGYKDITAMCQRYAGELPWTYECPIDKEVIDHIAKLLEQYMRDYIKAKGGRDKLKKYTEEELEKIEDQEDDELLDMVYGKNRRRFKMINMSKLAKEVASKTGEDWVSYMDTYGQIKEEEILKMDAQGYELYQQIDKDTNEHVKFVWTKW